DPAQQGQCFLDEAAGQTDQSGNGNYGEYHPVYAGQCHGQVSNNEKRILPEPRGTPKPAINNNCMTFETAAGACTLPAAIPGRSTSAVAVVMGQDEALVLVPALQFVTHPRGRLAAFKRANIDPHNGLAIGLCGTGIGIVA